MRPGLVAFHLEPPDSLIVGRNLWFRHVAGLVLLLWMNSAYNTSRFLPGKYALFDVPGDSVQIADVGENFPVCGNSR